MIALEPGSSLMFAGSKEPAAMLELSRIDLDGGQASRLAVSLCTLLEEQAKVAKDRVFIIFTSVDRRMWGWNTSTL